MGTIHQSLSLFRLMCWLATFSINVEGRVDSKPCSKICSIYQGEILE